MCRQEETGLYLIRSLEINGSAAVYLHDAKGDCLSLGMQGTCIIVLQVTEYVIKMKESSESKVNLVLDEVLSLEILIQTTHILFNYSSFQTSSK